LVPTESVLEASTVPVGDPGSSAKRPLKAPIPPSTWGVWVDAMVRRIRLTARLPASMSTPASA
jgi:hypothetical protein